MKSILFPVLLLLCVLAAWAQPTDTVWTRTFGGRDEDWARTAFAASDGGYYVAGSTLSYGSGMADFYLIKTDSMGRAVWKKTYGSKEEDMLTDAKPLADGGLVLAGYTGNYETAATLPYLVRVNSGGDTVWTHTYPTEFGAIFQTVLVDADGNYALIGRASTQGEGHNMYLAKVDAHGKLLWTKSYGGKLWDDGAGLVQTADGGYALAGRTDSYGNGKSDVFLVRTNASGDTLWTRTYGGPENDRANGIALLSDGGLMLVGESESNSKGLRDMLFIRTDDKGYTKWLQTLGETGDDVANSVLTTPDGGFVVAGFLTDTKSNRREACLLKLDGAGNVGWQHTYGKGNYSKAFGLLPVQGGYLLSGEVRSGREAPADMFVVKVMPTL